MCSNNRSKKTLFTVILFSTITYFFFKVNNSSLAWKVSHHETVRGSENREIVRNKMKYSLMFLKYFFIQLLCKI